MNITTLPELLLVCGIGFVFAVVSFWIVGWLTMRLAGGAPPTQNLIETNVVVDVLAGGDAVATVADVEGVRYEATGSIAASVLLRVIADDASIHVVLAT